jgi:hypothetical protein
MTSDWSSALCLVASVRRGAQSGADLDAVADDADVLVRLRGVNRELRGLLSLPRDSGKGLGGGASNGDGLAGSARRLLNSCLLKKGGAEPLNASAMSALSLSDHYALIAGADGALLRLYLRRCRPQRYFVLFHALTAPPPSPDRGALLDALGLAPSGVHFGFLPSALLPAAGARGRAWLEGWAARHSSPLNQSARFESAEVGRDVIEALGFLQRHEDGGGRQRGERAG